MYSSSWWPQEYHENFKREKIYAGKKILDYQRQSQVRLGLEVGYPAVRGVRVVSLGKILISGTLKNFEWPSKEF